MPVIQKTPPVVRYRIRDLRMQKNVSQKELAHRAQITPSYLNDVEHGRYSPSDEVWGRICVVLDLPPSAFVFLDTGV